MRTLSASGDAGDFIVSLSIAKTLGCRHVNIVDHHSLRSSFTARSHLVSQLAESQSYIEKVTVALPSSGSVDISGMRRFYQPDQTLMDMQRKEAMFQTGEWLPKDDSPWLEASPHSYSWGRIIVARSSRYHNDRFPWKEVVKTFRDRLLFVGIPEEHRSFESEFGLIEHYRTSNLMEVAEIIQGADMFIGNQSSPNAIAQGLGKKSVLEVSETSVDCIYKRDNVVYFTNKLFEIEGKTFYPSFTDVDTITRQRWVRAFANAGLSYEH